LKFFTKVTHKNNF